MKPAARRDSRSGPAEARLAIERFLRASKSPLFVEPGEDPITIQPDNHVLEWRSGYLTFEIWDETRNFSRRIVALERETRARLDLEIERFGKRTGTIAIVDSSAAQDISRRNARLTYRERFRRSLSRQFPGWRILDVSAEADLEHSLSPSYPRAIVRGGSSAWAAIGAGPESDADGVLTFGIIWLDYLRARERRYALAGLALFLPAGRERTTCLRLRWLNQGAAQYIAYAQFEDGFEDRIDLADYGNLDTHIERCTRPMPDADAVVEGWVDTVAAAPGVERIMRSDGNISLRVSGLEFARTSGNRLLFGLETRHTATASNLREIVSLAAGITQFRHSGASDRVNPLYCRNPEGWLESQVRSHLQQIDATLSPAPLYGQVPAFTGGDRDVIDLLAADATGRLAVLELKASEDIHLPLQALDYWMRVKWHAERSEFGANGYFPGVQLRQDAPRLMLVAPSLDFHPANEIILRYFDPTIEVERIGIGLDWRNEVKVMFRYANRR